MDGFLLRSIEENIPIEMIYLSKGQQISQRKLLVKEVNDEYIRAYCLLRNQIRTFRRENILSIMPNTRSKIDTCTKLHSTILLFPLSNSTTVMIKCSCIYRTLGDCRMEIPKGTIKELYYYTVMNLEKKCCSSYTCQQISHH